MRVGGERLRKSRVGTTYAISGGMIRGTTAEDKRTTLLKGWNDQMRPKEMRKTRS